MEKDFWVCPVLDALYNRLSGGHPNLLFKSGTSLSKAFGLIEWFSENIDLVVFRDALGFEGERDPTVAKNLSNRRRAALFKELRAACSGYIRGDLQTALTRLIDDLVDGCHGVFVHVQKRPFRIIGPVIQIQKILHASYECGVFLGRNHPARFQMGLSSFF